MDLKKAVTTRRSVKYFASKKVDWRKIIQAIDYARFAPAADNRFAHKFIIVESRDIIEKIAAAAQQQFISEASHVVVVVTDPSYLVKTYGERGERFAAQQAGASIENFLLALNERGLAAGWGGFFSDDLVKEALGVPDNQTIEAIFPIGKESKSRKSKNNPEVELDGLVYFDKWKNSQMGKE